MPLPETVDLTDPTQGELGDTHLLPSQVAEVAGKHPGTIRTHLSNGTLTEARALLAPEMHPVKHHTLYVVAVYDAKLYEYMDTGGIRTVWTDADKRRAARLIERMSYQEVSDRTGIPLGTLASWASEGTMPGREHPGFTEDVQWEGAQVNKAARKRRQRTAQRLDDEGHKLYAIAGIMGLHEDTIRRYLNGFYEPLDGWERNHKRPDA